MRPSLYAAIAALLLLAPAAVFADGHGAVFQADCASCHGADGKGDTPVGKAMNIPSLVDPKWADADKVAKKIREHVKKDLSDEQVQAAARYTVEMAK